MGMDIWASSGVILQWDEVTGFITDETQPIMRRLLDEQLAPAVTAADAEIAENAERLKKYNEEMKTWPEVGAKQKKLYDEYIAAREKAEEAGDEDEVKKLAANWEEVRWNGPEEWRSQPYEDQREWSQTELKDLKEILQPMLDDESIDGLFQTLSIIDQPSGEIETRYAECEAKYYDIANAVWPAFFQEAYPDFPSFSEVTAFGSSRISGGDVPTGVVVYIFNDDDCYERVPTEAGKKLFEVVGETQPSTWTIYSV